jgi:hypothetical protein
VNDTLPQDLEEVTYWYWWAIQVYEALACWLDLIRAALLATYPGWPRQATA